MRLGILGGGQLARMLALAGRPLDIGCTVLDPAPDACAAAVAAHVRAGYADADGLAALAAQADVVTFEFENVDPVAAASLAGRVPVRPAPAALEVARDRFREKELFRALGIATPRYAAVDDRAALDDAVAAIGLPAILKTRSGGYDGKGQAVLRRSADVDAAWAAIGARPAILEAMVPFRREVSIIGVRAADGEMRMYPLVENVHRDGILRLSTVRTDDPLQAQAQDWMRLLLERLDYVGVLTLELFALDDALLANEIAPRVHNSGHWTIEGARTSQFENHLRAVLGLPLGETAAVGCSAMVNLVGALPAREAVLAVPGAHLHVYGKEPRPGRKVGHITVGADDAEALDGRLRRLQALVDGSA